MHAFELRHSLPEAVFEHFIKTECHVYQPGFAERLLALVDPVARHRRLHGALSRGATQKPTLDMKIK